MKCYHMTTLDRLKSIEKMGLVPRNENNSKLIKDEQVKVFFSEGYEGTIALWVDFNIVYSRIKNQEIQLENKELNNLVCNSNNIKEYLGEGVFLCFDKENIINERNFENGCTSEIIAPDKISVVVIKEKGSNTTIYSRFEIINFMMSNVKPIDIKYYGANYPNSPTFEKATKRIQNKVIKFYEKNAAIIQKYKERQYEVIEIPLKDFLQRFR